LCVEGVEYLEEVSDFFLAEADGDLSFDHFEEFLLVKDAVIVVVYSSE
jgi:hypothetical protein